MKQGKVFDKLIARKNVQGITFQDKSCTVTLTNGSTKVCGTAHEARLFIEGKDINGATLKMDTPIVAQVAAVLPQPTPPAPVADCGTEAGDFKTIELDAAWVRRHAGDLVAVPRGANRIRVTVDHAAILLAGCAGPNAF